MQLLRIFCYCLALLLIFLRIFFFFSFLLLFHCVSGVLRDWGFEAGLCYCCWLAPLALCLYSRTAWEDTLRRVADGGLRAALKRRASCSCGEFRMRRIRGTWRLTVAGGK